MSSPPRPSVGRVGLLLTLGLFWFSLAFTGGYLQGQADAAAGRRGLTDLVLRAASAVGLQPPRTEEGVLTAEERARFNVFWEAWGLIEKEFYDRPKLDSQQMTYGAVRGLIETLDDPHTSFSTPREKQMQDSSLRGSFEGIGVQVDQRDGKLHIVSPIDGSPAQRAGLRAGDVITHVDGKDVKDLPLQEIVLLIRGPRGSTVTLTIQRPDEPAPLSVPVERAEIKLEQVRSKMLDGGIGYLRITSFSATSPADTSAAVKRLLDQDATGIVLDLRSNPGGFLNAAIEVASQFMSDGVVLYQQGPGGQRQEYRARSGGAATGTPVVVLIDKGSASASEIVAAALRDNQRASLVGEKSYGKGSVQTVHTLSDQSGLRVTTAIWLTPSGQPLEKQGILPDLAVAPAEGDRIGEPGTDAQLDAAIQHLRTRTAASSPPGRL